LPISSSLARFDFYVSKRGTWGKVPFLKEEDMKTEARGNERKKDMSIKDQAEGISMARNSVMDLRAQAPWSDYSWFNFYVVAVS
jgi:hypothetical protein